MNSFSSLYEKFDPSQARKLAGLIQQAYGQFNLRQAPAWALLGPHTVIKPLGTQKVPFGFVASEANGNDIFVVFRGTTRFIEWFKDVNIPLVSYKDSTNKKQERVRIDWDIAEGVRQDAQSENDIPTIGNFGYVTTGFRGIYINLRQAMIDALKGCNPNSRIFVTGHSLGGALATLAIPDILNNTQFKEHEKVELYTFASPRCGDRTFATAFQNTGVKHWRIANTEDMVTMLPFPTGNVFSPGESPKTSPEKDFKTNDDDSIENLGIGGVTGVDRNPNPLFGFFKAMYDRNKRRMPDYVHTGTPVYFTFHASALERHHNLDTVYMNGIDQNPLD